MTLRRLARPMNHTGKMTLAKVDLAEPGGMKTIRRLMPPRSTASRVSISSLWCSAGGRLIGVKATLSLSSSSSIGAPGTSIRPQKSRRLSLASAQSSARHVAFGFSSSSSKDTSELVTLAPVQIGESLGHVALRGRLIWRVGLNAEGLAL